MPGGIWEALGAALQAGGQTYNNVNQQQLRQKQLEEQQAIENAMRQKQMDIQQAEFQAQQEDRQRKILESAIEGLNPNQMIDASLVNKIKSQAPELMGRIHTNNTGDLTPFVGGGMGMGLGGVMPTTTPTFSRIPSFKEQNVINDRQIEQDALDTKKAFQTHLQSPEHQNESYDQQVQEALAHGLGNIPLSGKEFDRRQAIEQANRMAQINKMYPPERYPGGADKKVSQWINAYNSIEDNVRAKYSAELNAFARAAADGTNEDAQSKLEEIQSRIATETEALTTKLLGPRPGSQAPAPTDNVSADPTADVIANIDNDVQKVGGDYMALKKYVLANQASLRQRGIDVQAYIRAVRNKIPRKPAIVGGVERPIPTPTNNGMS
jgi:hypothetical protein